MTAPRSAERVLPRRGLTDRACGFFYSMRDRGGQGGVGGGPTSACHLAASPADSDRPGPPARLRLAYGPARPSASDRRRLSASDRRA